MINSRSLWTGAMALAMLNACHPAKEASKKDSLPFPLPAFNKEGHRGTRGLMPENTIPAMYKAIDIGVNTVEVDVVYSKDRKVVISHDLYFNPDITTTPEGKSLDKKEAPRTLIYSMDYDSVRKYDVGLKYYAEFPRQQKMAAYKPLLGELIDSTNAYARSKGKAILFNIELKTSVANDGIKHPPVEEFVEGVMRMVEEKNIQKQCYLQSFDFRPLQLIHKKYPGIVTAVLISDKDKRTLEQQLTELGYIPEMYSPHSALVTPELVRECHKRGTRIIPWTVNTPEEMKKLKEMGVDGIITDYPDYFSQL
ncbi:MAG TPA: glycerophosphodiester phosphodiesterase family protein [Chitinophagaceae bacterium]|nr:glycerophosphodiester phosphodiesterase family protein [Chitinophagaceae bacterium]